MRALRLAVLLAGFAGAASGVTAQPADTVRTASARPDSADVRTPRGAVTRALLLPGLGQVYNRQPIKAPVAAALVAGSVVYAVARQRQYVRYRRATVYAGCQPSLGGNPDTIPDGATVCSGLAPDYQDEWEALGSQTFPALRPVRERVRGQRDVSVLVVAVAYAFQALDAYVAAELADFDVSEDVAVRVRPEAVSVRVRL